ncbi:hypothetical protein QYE76_065000 [Lolium multiflorum]|uniref:Uncharacterized protein n=1 Tax=Lolium multiflorum TaxID=4521 RepID=A0AAD8W9L5_LOLMU|nr:hypothetical protein QYE76_065000 [Lolium multiflorum]
MENYSLLMGAAAVMKMAVEMAAVSMEKPSGGTSPSRGRAGTETPVPQILASRWRRLWKGALPPALDLDSFPCVEEAIRVADEFCDQYRALKREVEILQEENQRLRRMLEYYSIPSTRPSPPHSDNNESLQVLVQNCKIEKLKLKEILMKREKKPSPSSPKE